MNPLKLNRLGRLTAIITFGVATAILVCYYFTLNPDLLRYAVNFFIVAIVINLLVLSLLFREITRNTPQRDKVVSTCVMLLANVPVAFIYFAVG